MPNDCFFCGLAASDEFPTGDACALCNMMHDIVKREPDVMEMEAVPEMFGLYSSFNYPIM